MTFLRPISIAGIVPFLIPALTVLGSTFRTPAASFIEIVGESQALRSWSVNFTTPPAFIIGNASSGNWKRVFDFTGCGLLCQLMEGRLLIMENNLKQRGNAKGATSATAASQTRKFRQDRKLDLAGLSERLKAVNWPISVAALSRLENGERRIDVDDLMAISVALDISPLELLLPSPKAEKPFGTALPIELELAEVWAWAKESVSSIHSGPGFIRHWEKVEKECEKDLIELDSLRDAASESLRETLDRNKAQLEKLQTLAINRRQYWEKNVREAHTPSR